MSDDGSSPSEGNRSWWSRMSRSEQVTAAVLTAVVTAFAAIVVALINHSSGAPSSTSPGGVNSAVAASTSPASSRPIPSLLNFNEPPNWEAEGEVVSVTLTGTVPRGEHLWLFVHHAGTYYVQGSPTSQGPNLWSLPAVNLGSSLKSDLESWYTIYAVLANSQANKEIQVEYGNPDEVNYGMSTIPGGSGVKKAAYINLFRNH
jgi:hypothetical protein